MLVAHSAFVLCHLKRAVQRWQPAGAGIKKVLSIKSFIAVGTHGLPHAMAVTTRKGALQALGRCKPSIKRVQCLLCDVGQPLVQGVCATLGEHVTVQIAKRSELYTVKVMARARWSNAAVLGWRRTGDYGRVESAVSMPACSSCA